ncbi:MAG: aminotransferase class V-fold PLP-dependent enzyme, partial [Planctomycetes bacterium]|nr:aminotransferase class V-fold PLP-dependent enzyme [Planctomycetota bacterium]
MDLFTEQRKANRSRVTPLAVRMRPRTLDEFVGQQAFIGDGKLLRRMLEADRITSALFYGPPGTGKTSLATVIAAMSKPILGYLDPEFIRLMDSVADMLRQVFGAKGGFTLPVSGTGSAGMEAGLANLLEPGDLAVVAAHGFFGDRLTEIAKRQGATVVQVTTDWGSTVDVQAVEEELKRHAKVKLLAVVH